MVSLQDEVTIVVSLAAKVDPVALFLPGRPVQQCPLESRVPDSSR